MFLEKFKSSNTALRSLFDFVVCDCSFEGSSHSYLFISENK